LQMSRGKCGFKIPFSGDRSLIQTYSDLEGILSTFTAEAAHASLA
jgi:hypothetical protein